VKNLKQVHENAKPKLKDVCLVCRKCDGKSCISGVPGMGGCGGRAGFRRNIEALSRVMLNLRTIHGVSTPDSSYELFGVRLTMPIMGAPMCETAYNFLGQVDDYEFIHSQVVGAEAAGTIAFTGDSPDPALYTMGLKAIREKAFGKGIPIIKPREPREIIRRIKLAEENGVIAVGIDIDAAAFDNLKRAGQPVGPLTVLQLKQITGSTNLPVILKGIMTADQAVLAAECNAAGIVVSNHGGRALEHTPGTAEVLPEIVSAVKGALKIFIDGGFRSGEDVLKALALGAEAALIGRPVAIAAIGGETEGVCMLYNQLNDELVKAMLLTGCSNLASIDSGIIRESTW